MRVVGVSEVLHELTRRHIYEHVIVYALCNKKIIPNYGSHVNSFFAQIFCALLAYRSYLV